jgi:peptidoglycan/LPS O-acetylase OafA/YrhL
MLTVTAAESVTAPAQSGRVPNHYRPDIDGIRAIAILSVFSFHVGV